MREIESAIEKGDRLAKIGMEMYTYGVEIWKLRCCNG